MNYHGKIQIPAIGELLTPLTEMGWTTAKEYDPNGYDTMGVDIKINTGEPLLVVSEQTYKRSVDYVMCLSKFGYVWVSAWILAPYGVKVSKHPM